jgi:hypothetical protein
VRLTLFPILLLSLAACNRGIDDKDAIRQGVIDHLATRANLNMNAMKIDITSVSIKGDQADANVAISPKDSKMAGPPMTMSYKLQKQGNRWVVQPRPGTSPHGGMAMPPGMANPHGGGTMPPGMENPHGGGAMPPAPSEKK